MSQQAPAEWVWACESCVWVCIRGQGKDLSVVEKRNAQTPLLFKFATYTQNNDPVIFLKSLWPQLGAIFLSEPVCNSLSHASFIGLTIYLLVLQSLLSPQLSCFLFLAATGTDYWLEKTYNTERWNWWLELCYMLCSFCGSMAEVISSPGTVTFFSFFLSLLPEPRCRLWLVFVCSVLMVCK